MRRPVLFCHETGASVRIDLITGEYSGVTDKAVYIIESLLRENTHQCNKSTVWREYCLANETWRGTVTSLLDPYKLTIDDLMQRLSNSSARIHLIEILEDALCYANSLPLPFLDIDHLLVSVLKQVATQTQDSILSELANNAQSFLDRQ